MSWYRPMTLGVVCVVGMMGTAWAEDTPAKPQVQPFVAQTLQKMSAFLHDLQTFHVSSYSLYDLIEQGSGVKIKVGVAQEIVVQRPNHIYAEVRSEDQSIRRFWYDGKTVSVMTEGSNQYIQEQVPNTIDVMLDYIADHYDQTLPLSDLIRNNIGSSLEQDLLSGVYLGEKVIDGMRTHHLSFESQAADFQLWVDADEQHPLPRRLVINFTPLEGQPEYLASLRQWDLNPQIDAAMFTFTPPPGAQRTDSKPMPVN